MKTSSFLHYTGPGRISIARFAPRRTPARYRIYRPLAPGPWFNTVDEATYRDLYFREILSPLDPMQTADRLQQLAGDAEPVLLCWERLQTPGEFCHRRLDR
jgi:hypothetical protein